jgi:transcriptional regulator NrdR family protein
MVCIYCQSQTDITNSRSQTKTNTKWRRRTCSSCKAVLTTIESYDLSRAISVKSGNGYKPFSRDKLFISIFYSCKHLRSPENVAADLTDTIISKLLPLISDATISNQAIIETTAKTLKLYNKPAYVQYTAYHPL